MRSLIAIVATLLASTMARGQNSGMIIRISEIETYPDSLAAYKAIQRKTQKHQYGSDRV